MEYGNNFYQFIRDGVNEYQGYSGYRPLIRVRLAVEARRARENLESFCRGVDTLRDSRRMRGGLFDDKRENLCHIGESIGGVDDFHRPGL